MQRPFPNANGHKCPFGCNGYVTAMAVGQRQRLYSGVRIFTGNYLSSPPQILRTRGAKPELTSLIYIHLYIYIYIYISPLNSSSTPGVFYTCFYNHAHRLRLEKLLWLGWAHKTKKVWRL
jgi:hypothetical protein